ncbi:hypothetical protein C8R43DRAFT_958167 [Mycena crocata]|nr:hypothetical protein C8R43DRAFT_958167 [Mycena crocata]
MLSAYSQCKGFANYEHTHLLRTPVMAAKHKKQQLERDLRLSLHPATPNPLDTWLAKNHVVYFTLQVRLSDIHPDHEVLVSIWTRRSRGEIEGDFRDPDAFTAHFPMECWIVKFRL